MSKLFDMEQQIMACWQVVDDLNIAYHHMDRLDEDGQQNLLLGLIQIYQLKFEILFEMFEEVCAERKTGSSLEYDSNTDTITIKSDEWE